MRMKINCDGFIGAHYLGKEEIKACENVINSQSLFRYDGINLLHKSDKLENELRKFFNCRYALACSSGTAALKLCCISLGIGPGDEVLMSPFTYIASAGAVLSCGATPNFVDIDKNMNIDAKKIEDCITKHTKAILVVHIQGKSCDLDTIVKVAKKHNLFIIEDCAQSFGVKYKDNYVGTIGDVAAFSFQANKNITCGEGGLFICNNNKYYQKAKMYHDNGGYRSGTSYPVWDLPFTTYGENFKISEIQSAITIEQFNKFEMIKNTQWEIYEKISSFMNCDFRRYNEGDVPTRICIYFNSESKCLEFIKNCNTIGIPYEPYDDKLLTTYTTFINKMSWDSRNNPYNNFEYNVNKCPIAEKYLTRTAWLPICPTLTDHEIKYIINSTNKYS